MSCFCDGSPDSPLLVVGMAPGREELRHDTPFIGGSGKLLWATLKARGGLSRADCYILNVIGEWPELQGGAKISAVQLERWWDRFDEALAKFTGSGILLLGGDAMQRVAGFSGVTDWRGYIIKPHDLQPIQRKRTVQTQYKTSNAKRGIKKGDPREITVKEWAACTLPESVQWLLPTLHPAAILRTGFAQSPAFAADLGRVGRALRGELKPYQVEFLEGPPMPDLHMRHQAVAVDIETRRDGAGYSDAIERIGVASNCGAWTALWDHNSRFSTQNTFDTAYGPFIAHNIGFDAPRMAAEGCPIPEPWWDTMYAALRLQPDMLKGLNAVISLYTDRPRHKHLSESNPAMYNAWDAISELELYYILREGLRQTGQLEVFENVTMKALPILVQMTQEGILLDSGARVEWMAQLNKERDSLIADWQGVAGNVNPFSPKQLCEFLYGKLGLPERFNKYGALTTENSELLEMAGSAQYQAQRPIIDMLLRLRDVNKQLKTYAEVDIAGDGRVHPQWMPDARDGEGIGKGLAGTGRITSRDPNFQNIPKSARRLYVAAEGNVLIEADWNQIEARIIAALSGDVALAKALMVGLHATNMQALGVDKTRAKNFFYGWSYGAGARTLRKTFLAHGFDISEAECKEKLKLLERTYPQVTQWRQDVIRRVGDTRRLVNPFARRRFFHRGSGDAPAALDFLPQSTAADCMWAIVRPAADSLQGVGARLRGLIHDSVLVECPRSELAQGARCLAGIMEREFAEVAPGFHVPVEVKVGTNWGDMTEWKA